MRRVLTFTLLVLLLPAAGLSAEGTALRVVTYNIHHAAGTDGRVDLDRVARVLTGADVIGLQECDVRSPRSLFADEPAAIARRLGLRYHVFGETQSWFWFNKYGNAILSRYPIVGSRNFDLPRLSVTSERRRMLRADVRVGGQVVHVFVTHLSLRQEERARQTAEIARILGGTSGRSVLVGDFNALPPSSEIATVKARMRDAWDLRGVGAGLTIPSWRPTRRIDFVFVPPSGIDVDSILVRPTRQQDGTHPSDHLPVEAAIRLR